ncbi:NAD(P)-binding protein [Athelia psychrophila]|uniref:NAD(P)-binding protein n=1 Tax=Athelia psychrophila TaxID=1759441 RepID=A0A166R674_9AGAM|nr:NAD(P)-binding protein [Fibularhizoctonia sp. CBS 109695]
MDLGLKGVHVLITGASGGIGLETASLFIDITAHGANVTLHCNSNPVAITALMEMHGRDRVHCVMANLAEEDKVEKIFYWSSVQFGPVQILIVLHGIWPKEDVPLVDMSLSQWSNTLQTNLTSSFLVCREYLRALSNPDTSAALKENASIVLIGSTAGKFGEAGHADYAVSKGAMMSGLVKSLAVELPKIAPRGRVNCIAPGWVNTPLAAEALQNPRMAYKALATTPLKKVATKKDIANQIAWIASNTVSGHVTGEVIMVAGGMEGRLLNTYEEVMSA